MKVIVCGGGTGGHIYPALSIAMCFRQRGAEVLYMGSRNSTEEKLAAQNGFPFLGVEACGLHKRSPRLVRDLMVNARGLRQAKKELRSFQPDVVIGTGGYAEAAVVKAAQQLDIKTVLHEQNAFPGLANRYLARHADAVCLTFAEAQQHFPALRRFYLTGLPVREKILTASRQAAYDYFSIPQEEQGVFTLLVTGGSLGARTLNNATAESYLPLLEQGIRIIHITGGENYAQIKAEAPVHEWLILLPYLNEMEHALALADLACARSGASFLAEAACLGLPTVLVPYPYAANDHQRFNAGVFAEKDAAVVVEDNALTAEVLQNTVMQLVHAPERLAKMAAGAKELAQTHAAEKIVEVACSLCAQAER